jgi:hypothetical protein
MYTRGHVDDTVNPECFDTGGCSAFFPEVLNLQTSDLVRKFELWAVRESKSM